MGRKRVARLMRQARIQGVHRRRKMATTRANPAQAAAPDLVRREFTADGPDRIWVSDITYVPTKARYLYLAVVLDLWSRKVVGWSMREDLTAPLVTDALDMAIGQRKPDRVIHHSDRGSQPIQLEGIQGPMRAGRHQSIDGTPRRRVRQCRSRVVLRHPRNRTPAPDQLHQPEPGPLGGLRLHRRVLQPTPAALRHRIPLTQQLRKEPSTTLWITNREVSEKAGQLHLLDQPRGGVFPLHRRCGGW